MEGTGEEMDKTKVLFFRQQYTTVLGGNGWATGRFRKAKKFMREGLYWRVNSGNVIHG